MTSSRTAKPWTETATHIDVVQMEIDGRDVWLGTDDIGLIAMSPTREGLESALGDAVLPREPRWAAPTEPNDA